MALKPQRIHTAEVLSSGILFILYLCSGLYFVFLGKFWTDENWYYSGSVLTSKGLHPHFDFLTHHNPIYFYVYSIPQYVFGPNFLAGRLTSMVFTLCIFVFVYVTARRLGGWGAALLAGAFLTFNLFSTNYFVTTSYHALESLFMVLFFFFMSSGIRGKYKYTICTVLLLLTVGTRYIIDISGVFLFSYLAYLYFKGKDVSWSFSLQLMIVSVVIILLVAPYIPIFERMVFQTVLFNFFQTGATSALMLGENNQISILFFRLNILKKLFGNFLPVLFAIFSIGAGMIWLGLTDRNGAIHLWRENTVFCMMIVFVIISELFYQIPVNSWPVTRLYYFPVACIAAGVVWTKLASSSRDAVLKPAYYILPVVLILFSVFLQERPNVRASWETSHLYYLGLISKYLKKNTPSDAELFTFTPPFVIEADRKLSLNMLMETWQIFPEMPTEKAKKYGLVNIEMILEELNEKRPYTLVLKKPGRLEDNGGKGRILIPYRDIIWETINKNYYLAHTIPMKKEVDGVVNIYFQR